ncbi:DNA mismatch endonuclease Vsr [uncultured archaeon]|nr:DNA mismatch endonuclease Vsr [uncultured archaeon]
MDTHTEKQRSFNMSRIKSKWTRPEVVVHKFLIKNKIKHKMHPKINGHPDLILKGTKTAIFVNGCFWHKCKKCFKWPKSNLAYWKPKIMGNVKRDRKNYKKLRKMGFEVIILWEHDIKRLLKQ